jgi:adenylate cyclase
MVLDGGGQASTRRLAAILTADVAGYSRLMGEDEEGTLKALKPLWRDLADPKINEHRGRIVKKPLATDFWWSLASSKRCAARLTCTARWPAQHCRPGGTADRIPAGINLSDIIKGRGDIYATA